MIALLVFSFQLEVVFLVKIVLIQIFYNTAGGRLSICKTFNMSPDKCWRGNILLEVILISFCQPTSIIQNYEHARFSTPVVLVVIN